MSDTAFEILVILLLILLNGLFALSEMSIVTSRLFRLQDQADAGDARARSALRLAREPDKVFSAVQLGITLIGIITGAYGGTTLADRLARHFAGMPALRPYSEALAIGLVVVPIACLSLVLGELIPKRLAVAHPERVAKAVAPFMRLLMRLTMPAVGALGALSSLILRLLPVRWPEEASVTEVEIRGIIGEGARVGVLESQERDMVERVFRLGDRQVGALMTHRSRIEWLDLDDPPETNLRKMEESPYSRFPVAQGDLENTIGVVKAKDVLAGSARAGGKIDLRGHIRRPLYVPETMRALRLLESFRKSRMHFALIVDEYGDIQGLVTLNDILEAIVGDLPSSVEEEPAAVRREDGSWLLDGMLPLDEVGAILDIDRELEDEDRAFQTLAGFMLKNLDRIPAMADSFEFAGYRFEVVDMDGKRVDRVLVMPLPRTGKVEDQDQE